MEFLLTSKKRLWNRWKCPTNFRDHSWRPPSTPFKPRMVRRKLSYRIAHTVGRGLPPFKYASWRPKDADDLGKPFLWHTMTLWRGFSSGLEDLLWHYRLTATAVSARISSTKVSNQLIFWQQTHGISSWMLVGSILSWLMMDFLWYLRESLPPSGGLIGIWSLFGIGKV